jgi:hypothetical protein
MPPSTTRRILTTKGIDGGHPRNAGERKPTQPKIPHPIEVSQINPKYRLKSLWRNFILKAIRDKNWKFT